MRGVEITTASGSSRIRSSPTGYVAYLRVNGGTLIYLFFLVTRQLPQLFTYTNWNTRRKHYQSIEPPVAGWNLIHNDGRA